MTPKELNKAEKRLKGAATVAANTRIVLLQEIETLRGIVKELLEIHDDLDTAARRHMRDTHLTGLRFIHDELEAKLRERGLLTD